MARIRSDRINTDSKEPCERRICVEGGQNEKMVTICDICGKEVMHTQIDLGIDLCDRCWSMFIKEKVKIKDQIILYLKDTWSKNYLSTKSD